MSERVHARIGLLWLVVALSAAVVSAQSVSHVDHSSPSSGAPHIGVLVNGADDPDAIPDDLAYAHFILAVLIPPKPSLDQARMRDAALSPVHLSTADRVALISSMEGLYVQLAFLDKELDRLAADPTASVDRITDLKMARSRALGETQVRITTRLSTVGRFQLEQYLRSNVKPNIVIYGDAPSQ